MALSLIGDSEILIIHFSDFVVDRKAVLTSNFIKNWCLVLGVGVVPGISLGWCRWL
ncbi:hypothetical protein CPB85DRAFT_1343764 [Mucidula mucida]|nr:hypothetical protein CPB85DRAFT_1343764 [Mucidula mucida]